MITTKKEYEEYLENIDLVSPGELNSDLVSPTNKGE